MLGVMYRGDVSPGEILLKQLFTAHAIGQLAGSSDKLIGRIKKGTVCLGRGFLKEREGGKEPLSFNLVVARAD